MAFEIERQHRVRLGEDMRRATEDGIARIRHMEDRKLAMEARREKSAARTEIDKAFEEGKRLRAIAIDESFEEEKRLRVSAIDQYGLRETASEHRLRFRDSIPYRAYSRGPGRDLSSEVAVPTYDWNPSLKSVPRRENLASDHCKKIVAQIREFEAGLDEQHEIGVKMINFGPATFHPTHIKFLDPDLIVFCGKMENGDPFQVVQHASQISIFLVKMKRDTTAPKTPIGFSSEANRD